MFLKILVNETNNINILKLCKKNSFEIGSPQLLFLVHMGLIRLFMLAYKSSNFYPLVL